MVSTIQITLRGPRPNQFAQVGKLLFGGFSPTAGADPYGLRATFEWIAGKGLEGTHQARWVWLDGEVTSARPSRRRFGSVLVSTDQGLPPLDAGSNWGVTWLWRLTPEDIEAIETDRADPPSPPSFFLSVRGILELDGSCHMVEGEGQLLVALSDWQQHLTGLGYGIPPSIAGLAESASSKHPSWTDADKRLATAREALRLGDGHGALAKCLGAFEALVTAPYNDNSWLSWLHDGFAIAALPEQKANSIARLLSAHCSLLNRVGHHRDREEQDLAGDLLRMPLSHWEAELIVGSSQMLLAYALRLSAGRTTTKKGPEQGA